MLRIKWIIKSLVIEAEEQPPVRTPFCVDAIDARDLAGDPTQDAFKSARMFTLHVLNDVPKIVSVYIQASLGAC